MGSTNPGRTHPDIIEMAWVEAMALTTCQIKLASEGISMLQ